MPLLSRLGPPGTTWLRRLPGGVLAAVVVLLALALAPVVQGPEGGTLSAQEMAAPVETQWSVFDRVLTFDRSFGSRNGDEIVVGILIQARNRESVTARDQVVAAARQIEGAILGEDHVRFVSIEAGTEASMKRTFERESVSVLYVTPLRAADVESIGAAATELDIVTLTGVREYVEDGIGLGVGLRGGRPEILVNLNACRASGMDLSSEVLKLATVVSADPNTPRKPNSLLR